MTKKKDKTKKTSGSKVFLWILVLALGFIPLPFVYNSCGEGGFESSISLGSKSPRLHLDDEPPKLELTSHPAKQSNQGSAEFRFSVQDTSPTQTECKLNDESWMRCSSVWSRNNLEEGDHTFYIRSEDVAQNKSEVSFSWHVDFKVSSIALTQTPEDINNDSSSIIEFQISGGNFKGLSYYFGTDYNGQPDVSLTKEHSRGKMNFRVLLQTEEGRNYFKVRGIDEFGNPNFVQHSWFVDRTPPSRPRFRSPLPPHRISDSNRISFDLLAEDNHEVMDIYYTLDGGRKEFCFALSYQENEKRCQKDVKLDQGSHSISFIARDLAGNESASLQHNWDVTFTPMPKTQFLSIGSMVDMVDILFVVKQSMGSYQGKLAKEWAGFIDGLRNRNWRIAFITTTVTTIGLRFTRPSSHNSDGFFVPVKGFLGGFHEKYFFTSSFPPLLALQGTPVLFESTIKSIKSTDRFAEKGLEAVDRALQRYKDCQTSTASECTDHERGQPNKKFFRSDAVLAVILFSDQDEEGSMTPEDLKNRITNRFFNATKKFVFHSIIADSGNDYRIRIPDLRTCHEAGDLSAFYRYQSFVGSVNSPAPHKYLKMSQLTNGMVMNIKSESYTSCLKSIGESVIRNLVTELQLECEPVAERTDSPVDEPIIKHNTNPNAANNASYILFNELRTRRGARLSFQNPLPAGRYKITYYCAP